MKKIILSNNSSVKVAKRLADKLPEEKEAMAKFKKEVNQDLSNTEPRELHPTVIRNRHILAIYRQEYEKAQKAIKDEKDTTKESKSISTSISAPMQSQSAPVTSKPNPGVLIPQERYRRKHAISSRQRSKSSTLPSHPTSMLWGTKAPDPNTPLTFEKYDIPGAQSKSKP